MLTPLDCMCICIVPSIWLFVWQFIMSFVYLSIDLSSISSVYYLFVCLSDYHLSTLSLKHTWIILFFLHSMSAYRRNTTWISMYQLLKYFRMKTQASIHTLETILLSLKIEICLLYFSYLVFQTGFLLIHSLQQMCTPDPINTE